ncbi:helix-turn-helix domain-containing protein [Enhygromyxa salina]|uniref:Transcriptional repressor DicA n=1 Tax=Enhygromyxa salina TaxID=215803 RepID=A0A2S9YA86_9BACT|nr:helix-turn-helix transcriptional regulator [Enhygromyxa salina]PRQ02028.1 transcriptional repressor DicA [Enhygromyxa salina]
MLTIRQISRRLVDRRRTLGMTQEALADAAGLSPETIRRLERGRRQSNLFTFCKVAEALQTTPSVLLAEKFSEETVELVLGLPDAEQEIATVMLRALSDHVTGRPGQL